MRSRATYSFFLFLALPATALAQPDSTRRVDTLKSYRMPEVVVVDQRSMSRVASSPQPLAVIGRGELQEVGARDLADAVAYSPGVFVKQYGGLGGLRTISLRGTSAQQTVVLIDGVRMQNSSADAFDLGSIPSGAIERVEVMRGGSASIHGANALGGVVNVVTRMPGDDLYMTANGRIASFGERQISINGGIGSQSDGVDVELHGASTSGEYPFSFREYGRTLDVRRDNSDYRALFGRATWVHRERESGLRLRVSAQGSGSERGVPGAVVQGNREQLNARMTEEELFANASALWSLGEWQTSVIGSARSNGMRYRDPDARYSGPAGIDNRYDRREGMLGAHLRRILGENAIVDGAADISYANLRGDNLDPAAGSSVDRWQGGGSLALSWRIDEPIPSWELTLDAGGRADWFSDFGSAISPSIGVVLHPLGSPLRLRGHAGLAFRAPSFSEQYYLNYGNTDLLPERSTSVDAGVTLDFGTYAIEAGAFLIDTRDQIVAVPRSPVSWSAMNVGHTLSRGIEIAGAGSLLDDVIDLRLSYTIMRAEDRTEGESYGTLLVYSPQELASGITTFAFGSIRLSFNGQYVSHRYTLPLELPESALPHYFLLGASLSGRWTLGAIDLGVTIDGSNLFDREYQVVRNYPMPGRSVALAVEVRWREGDRATEGLRD